jgi:hypothetical protein
MTEAMTLFLASTLAVQIACTPSEITLPEAKALAIHAAAAIAAPSTPLNAEVASLSPENAWSFRVLATQIGPGSSSNLIGWYSVDKRTAALTDPVLDGKLIAAPNVVAEQAALRASHCQPSN